MPNKKGTIAKKIKATLIVNEERLRVHREKKQKYRK